MFRHLDGIPGHLAVMFFAMSLVLLFNGAGCNGPRQEPDRLSSPQLSSSLSGEVCDGGDGRTLAGALLVLENGEASFTSITNALGNFSFDGIPPGNYRLTAGTGGYVTAIRSILLGNGESKHCRMSLAPYNGRGNLDGTVVEWESSGGSVPLTSVDVVFPYDGISLNTDASGHFQATGLSAGLHLLRLSLDGYRDMEAYVEITAGDTLRRTFEMLDVAGSLRGVVTGEPGGTAVSGGLVSIDPLGLSTVTAADGSYGIDRVSSGVWPVTFMAPSYDSTTVTTTISAGETTTLDVRLDFGYATVRGTVRDALSSSPLQNVLVSIPQSRLTTRTSVFGTYQFYQEVRTGPFVSVGAESSGYVTSGTYVSLGPGDVVDVDFNLVPASGDLTGTVRTTNAGVPIVGAVCTITHLGVSSTTNSSGRYYFDDLPPGYTPITVSATGFQTITTSAAVVAGTTSTSDIYLPTAP